jgi:hypothetical protein
MSEGASENGRQPLLVEAAHSEAEQVIARIHMRAGIHDGPVR